MITASSPSSRHVALAGVLTLLIAIVLAAILLLPDRSLAQAGEPIQAARSSSPAGPLPPPPLNPPIQTPEPGQDVAAPAIGRVDADIEAIRFQPKVRLERGQVVVSSQDTDKPAEKSDPGTLKPLAQRDVGPQEAYQAPDIAGLLSPMDWIPLLYENFVGFSPPDMGTPFSPWYGTSVWAVYDNSNDGYERSWGANNWIYYYHDDDPSDIQSAWPAAFGADALDPNLYFYPENLNSWLDYGPIDLSNMADVFVSFGLWYNTEPENDRIYFCASTDGSNYSCDSWSGDSGGWTDQAYWLTSYAGHSEVWLAWVFQSNATATPDDGPFVDEIWVWGDEIGGTPTPTPTPDPAGELIENGSFETGDLTGWQVYSSAANPIQNGDFEDGPDGSWTEYSFQGWPLIVDVFPGSVAPHSGSWAAWLGGADNEISAIQQSVTVPSGSPVLSFWYWIASADGCGHDFGGVIVNSTVVDVFDLCSAVNTNGWVRRAVDLSGFVGQTVQLDIRAETNSSLNSNLFVDDVTFGSWLLTLNERQEAASPPASMQGAGNPARGKSASGLLPNSGAQGNGVPILLGPGRSEPKPMQDADAPSPETRQDLEPESTRPPLRGIIGVEEPLGITGVGVTDATAVEGQYSAYLWRNGAGEDFLYQIFAVPADVNGVVLNFWFAVTTDETGVGRDFFCGSLRPAADLNTIWVDMGCIDSTNASGHWQEVLYTLTPDEVDRIKGQTAVLIFELYNTGAAGTGTAGWVDYVQVYATGGGAGGALDPNEPNDDPSSATTINCGDTIDTGVIGDALGGYDVDWFRLSNVPTGRIDVDIDADTLVPPSALDSVVGLWDNNLNLVDWDDDDGVSYDSYIVYTNTVNNATFYISVEHYWVYGSPDSFYDLTVQCAGSGAGLPPPPPEESPEENTWTVMLYLNAEDPNFEDILTGYRQDIEGFIDAPMMEYLNVVILYDGPGTSGTTRYLVQPNGNYTTGTNRWNMGELNMGHPDTLANFATWAMDQYPAENYYLAIDDHGDGAYGISWDPSSNNDQLTPPELYSALKSATRDGTRKIDIFDYEACLMGLAENAYDLREWVDYVVFFEQISWGIDTYPQYFRDLAETDTPLQVGRRIVDRYYAEANGANNGRGYPHTISLIDTSQMVAVRNAVSNFGNALKIPDNNDRKDAVKAARGSSQAFAADIDATNPVRADYIDLWDFAHEASSLASAQAAAVRSAVDAAVVHERHASGMVSGYTWDHSGAHGLSVYYPHSQTSSAFSGYGSLYQMSRDGTWDEFLNWAVPVGRGRGMSSFRTEIKLTDEDAFTFKDVYLPMVLK